MTPPPVQSMLTGANAPAEAPAVPQAAGAPPPPRWSFSSLSGPAALRRAPDGLLVRLEARDLRVVVARLVEELRVDVDDVVLRSPRSHVWLNRIWSSTCELPSNTYE